MLFQCSSCDSIVSVDDVDAGIMVRCGHCNCIVQVPPTKLSRGAVVGDFIIQRLLGQGGMGAVYLSHQISLDRPAALKILAESYTNNAEFVTNFIKEARSAAALNHPHIVQAYAVGEYDKMLYFAMENVDGETMKTVLEREGRIPIDYALYVIQQIAEALDYAWNEARLIHCDIKPDNIMLTSTGRAKLADLGLARVTGDMDDLDADEVLGTPQYISPEALTGAPLDTRSDIYSLGATFYHFITGRFPFDGSTPAEIANKHLTEPLIPPASLDSSIPENISRIILKMMAKNPIMRYQTAAELIDDLRNARRGNPVASETDTEIFSSLQDGMEASPDSADKNNEQHRVLTMNSKDNSSGDRSRNIYNLKRQQQEAAKKSRTVMLIALFCLIAVVVVGAVLAGMYSKTALEKKRLEEAKAAEQRELERSTPMTDDVDAILAFERENPSKKREILAMCEAFIAKDYKPSKPKEEQALAAFQALYVQADEAVMALSRDSESRNLRKMIAQRQDAAESAAEAEQRARQLEREKIEADEWARRENENREEKLARLALEMKEKLTQEKDYYAGRMIQQTMNGHLDRVEEDYNNWLQTLKRQEQSEDSILSETARPFREWAKYVLDCIASAKIIHENTYNGNTVFKGTQIGYGKAGLCRIESVLDGVVKAIPSAGSKEPITFKFDDIDARQRLVLLRKGAGDADKSDELYFYLLLHGDFVNVKNMVAEDDSLDEPVSYIMTAYFKYILRDASAAEISSLRSKYGTLKEFKEAYSSRSH